MKRIFLSGLLLLLLCAGVGCSFSVEDAQPTTTIEDPDPKTEIIPFFDTSEYVFPDTQVSISPDWKEDTIPEPFSKKWERALNSSENGLSVKDDMLVAGINEDWFYRSDKLQVEDGVLLGYDKGEWGGGIVFRPDDGLEYELVNMNFQGFFLVGDRIYALTGLVHIIDFGGNIYEIRFIEDKWTAEWVYSLGSCPELFLVVDDTAYIATNKTLVVMRDGGAVETLVDDAFWTGLDLSSIIYANQSVFIGMQGGVYSYDTITGKETWYNFIDRWYERSLLDEDL